MKRAFIILFVLLLFTGLHAAESLAGALPRRITLMWQVDKSVSDEDLSTFRQTGVNVIHSFNLSGWNDTDIQSYLDRAAKHGIGVIAYLGEFTSGGFLSQEGADFVTKWKAHPSIVAWHYLDEPKEIKTIGKSAQKDMYNAIKALDPQRPVMVSINNTTQADYDFYFNEDAFDILDIHAYVNPYISNRQHRLVKLFMKNRKREYPVIITLRAFNGPAWSDLSATALQEQYAFFALRAGITDNIGFYGWNLNPNKGIKDADYIKSQFLGLKR